MALNAFRDIDRLQDWFNKLDAPYWTLYSGRDMDRTKRIAVNNSIRNPEQSFQWLSETITAMSENGGTFHIHLKNSPKEDADVKTTAEKAAQRITSLGFHAIFDSVPTGIVPSSINGYPNIGNLDRLVEEKVNIKMEILEKDMEIAALSEALKEKKDKDKILGMTTQEFIPFVMSAISQISGLLKGNDIQTPALKISGFPKQDATPTEASKTKQAEITSPDFTEEELDSIENSIDRISVHIPNVVEILEKLATYVETKPAMAKMLLSNLD